MRKTEVTIVGGGMITHDQLLPSLYHMQRQGRIGAIRVCASRGRTVAALAQSDTLRQAFPGQSFEAFPHTVGDPEASHPEMFREVIARMAPHNIFVVAVPDQLHYDVIRAALQYDQHVCAVKPLVLKQAQAAEIASEAFARGLVVGVEYHKRFDD
ncbi:MAG: Gfo/Idh/MocA family oxidoreductase, partial [Acidobacteriota bacterium]|nr:Gfo/Idh/MocA family oxidoreductase [Acidobacteriota bacterium]